MHARTRSTILIVDDETNFREAVAETLRLEGYSVVTAANGLEAIDLFRQHAIDVALLDVNMPLMNGWDAFKRLTALDPMLPILIVTARPDLRQTADDCGADALLEKPVDMEELLSLVGQFSNQTEETRPKRMNRAEKRLRFNRERNSGRQASALNE